MMMRITMFWLVAGLSAITGAVRVAVADPGPPLAVTATGPTSYPETALRLGAFSVSLSVKDLAASRAFYEKLGFQVRGGDPARNWLVLKNGSTVIGLFQGMFPRNMLTFNPGWDSDAKKLPDFEDVREVQKRLKSRGVTITTEADENSKGPASFVVIDPDGNPVLVDQHL